MPGNIIQWFPGHMAQTRRMIKENLSNVDIIFELLDARIPRSSENPEIRQILGEKKTVLILNKADLADEKKTLLWKDYFRKNQSIVPVEVNCKSGKGFSEIMAVSRSLLQDKISRNREKGITKPIRAMVVGIPNVGKSTLINRFAGVKKAQAENRPGVTKTKQWVKASEELELLDMPGVLWPKFDDTLIGENLAITGAIKDSILQSEEIACILCERLRTLYPEALKERYKLSSSDLEGDAYDLFLRIGKKRGMLMGGGNVNEERCAAMLLEEFRSGALGKISLEVPE